MGNMISTYRNSERQPLVTPLTPSNKLLLLNIRHIRRESTLNFRKAQSMTVARVNATPAATDPPVKAFIPKRVSSSLLLPKPRFSTNLNVIDDAKKQTPSEDLEKNETNLSSSRMPQIGSFSHTQGIPVSDDSLSSLYTVYAGNGDAPTLRPNVHSSLNTRSSPAGSFSHPVPSNQSMTSRLQENEWQVPFKTRLLILVNRIVRCMRRDHNYFYFHLLSACVVGVSVGLSFFRLQDDLKGLNDRFSVLMLSVFFFALQGVSGRIWHRKDDSVFTRDARCGYVSSLEYFGVVTALDRVLLRCVPSILYVVFVRALSHRL